MSTRIAYLQHREKTVSAKKAAERLRIDEVPCTEKVRRADTSARNRDANDPVRSTEPLARNRDANEPVRNAELSARSRIAINSALVLIIQF